MSSDIDIKDQLWLTVRAEGRLELNMDDGASTMHVQFDPRDPEDRRQLELLKSTIQRCLNISSTLYEGDL
jgi:hypothetical protein